jgi:hypothetical protein
MKPGLTVRIAARRSALVPPSCASRCRHLVAVEGRRVVEDAADRAIGLRSRACRIAQPPEGQREVCLILCHDVEQILRQLAIALAFVGEAELAPETP